MGAVVTLPQLPESISLKQFKMSTLQYYIIYLVRYFGYYRVEQYDFESADARLGAHLDRTFNNSIT